MLLIYIFEKESKRMNSYQSTIESQSDSTQIKYGQEPKSVISLRRASKRIKAKKIFKIQHQANKIQIQEPLIQGSNFSQQVRDYVQDITTYLTNTQSSSIITDSYMEWQVEINVLMREILTGWLGQVSSELNLKTGTLHLACLLVDKYCQQKKVYKVKYQVLGAACLYIAAKYGEINTPKLIKYLHVADGAYQANQLLHMQSQILMALNFNIRQKSTLTLYDIKCQQYQLSKSVLELGYFILEMSLVQYEFCRKKPAYLSLAVLYTVMKLKKKKMPKVKVFASQNNLDEEIFTTYLDCVLQLYSSRHLSKFGPIVRRYCPLFSDQGELR